MRPAAAIILVIGMIIAAWMIYSGVVSERFRGEAGMKVVGVKILESVGMSRVADKPRIEYVWSGESVIVTFLEDSPNPCYRHRLGGVERLDSTININLVLEKTSEVCIQVLGTVKTKLLIGPVEPSTKIVINGLEIVLYPHTTPRTQANND